MQSPMIVFDHITKQVSQYPSTPEQDKKVAEVLAAQRAQTATASSSTNR